MTPGTLGFTALRALCGDDCGESPEPPQSLQLSSEADLLRCFRSEEHLDLPLLPLGVATVESAMVSTSVGSLRFRCWAIPRITRKPRPQICLTERLTARAVLLPSGVSVLDTTGGTSHGWNVYEEDTDDDGDDDGENRLRMSSSGGARYLAACCCRRCCFL